MCGLVPGNRFGRLQVIFGAYLSIGFGCTSNPAEVAQTQPAVDVGSGSETDAFVDDQKDLVDSIILDPSPGRPVFVKPGESFYCLLRASTKLGKRAFITCDPSAPETTPSAPNNPPHEITQRLTTTFLLA